MLWRWTIDTASGAVSEAQLSDQPLEFPRVDERVVGRKHGTGYATEMGLDSSGNVFSGALVRIDASGSTQRIDLGPGRSSGEWMMVPRHADAAEDDGWLLSLVHRSEEHTSELPSLMRISYAVFCLKKKKTPR